MGALMVMTAACEGSDGLEPTPGAPDAEGLAFDLPLPLRDVGRPDLETFRPEIGPVDFGVEGEEDIGFFDGGLRDSGEDGTDIGGAQAPAVVNLSFRGACRPDFGGMLAVSISGNRLVIGSQRGPELVASLQLELGRATGAQILSTAHRLQTNLQIAVVAGAEWVNLANEPDRVVNQEIPDPISGTLLISEFEPGFGLFDLTFFDVNLQTVSDGSICTVDGTVQSL